MGNRKIIPKGFINCFYPHNFISESVGCSEYELKELWINKEYFICN